MKHSLNESVLTYVTVRDFEFCALYVKQAEEKKHMHSAQNSKSHTVYVRERNK